MVTENEIKLILEKIISQRQRLKEIDIAKKQLESERKSVEWTMNWNEKRIIEYLQENNLRKLLLDKYSFLLKKLPSKVIKLLKPIEEFPDKYKTPPEINKRLILIDYHRKENLKDYVEISNPTKLFITELEDATVDYTNEKKGIKRLSSSSDQ